MTRPVVYSASSVNSYLACHLQWWFTYVLMSETTATEAQATGIAVHDAAEQILKDKPYTVIEPEPVGSLVTVFQRDILPTYREPVLVEAFFELVIDGIPFSGVIDSVDRHDIGPDEFAIILRDLKTTKSRPAAGKYRFNLYGYWLGARDLGYEADIMQLDYIVRTKEPYYWPEVVDRPDNDDLAIFARTLTGVANAVERSDYRPTGLGTRACASCDHAAICGPYKRYTEVTNA